MAQRRADRTGGTDGAGTAHPAHATQTVALAGDSLSDPLPLPCGQVLPNRLMKAALSEGLGDSTHGPGIRLERLYTRWGTGGFGLVITGNVMVDRAHLGEPGNVVVDSRTDLDALTRWAKSAQDGGTPIWMQINHPGRQANPLASRSKPVAPSAIAPNIPGIPVPRELTHAEIEDIIDRFARVAHIAETAGFNGVQIHGAHGYLVSQFLSPLANQREDQWGGDTERRMRFVLEIVRRIRSAVSPGFAVGIKLNSADFQRGGFTEDESRLVAQRLASEGIDLIEISGGSYESPAMMGRPKVASTSTQAREAYFLEYARTVRSVTAGVPLAVTGGFRTFSGMSEAVRSGDCDVVGIGRPAAVIPEAAEALLQQRSERLNSPRVTLGLPRQFAGGPLKAFDGALDLQWHTDQLHRLGAGADTDPSRAKWRTAVTMVQRNGFDAFRSRRSSAPDSSTKDKTLRKFKFERAVGRYIANPAVRVLSSLGLRTSFATELETIGRKSGQTRRVPVSAAFDETGAWVISQHGKRSGWGLNITANPTVRIRQGNRWRTGIAEFRPEDDVTARARTFGPQAISSITAAGFQALQSTPISVRISFTDS
ncbi:nitroreductase family deazaflavin-dependent oxidoreductase [Hoyosella altamirensis]|uniref:Deazaflavin-dependent oxidoreductase (Nitroreductase family) n=1 Tax=Hoyosella altamirensis TaxID=616997 RepID=A0A839RQT8_9ACTN|nr:nitroreductase family deazaflavin-dependent oxidoreductase [Hoyosella altamirensis]MBB3038231.1 deazaflavin-dependent oxidoreductase (nitroreductase family) [Hoyosella altamirensis]